MKVEVIEMRHKGEKVQVSEASRLHVGYLRVFGYSAPGGSRTVIAALFPAPGALTHWVLESAAFDAL
jgi:hypothetical protein